MTRTTTARARQTLRAWVVPAVVATVAVTAACSPIETDRPYSPSDGLRVNLTDDLRGLNLMVVSGGEGEPGALIGAFANESTQDEVFEIAPDGGAGLTVPVDAGSTVYLGTEDGFDAQFGSVDVPPGGVLPVTVSVSSGEEQTLSLPVLDGTLEEYAHLLP